MSTVDPGDVKPVRVLLVDDHPVVLKGLSAVLGQHDDVDIVATAVSGSQALALADSNKPDVVLLDLQIPPPSGADLVRQITTLSPGSRILILTTYDDDHPLMDSIAAGASGYLLKGVDEDQLVDGIRRVHSGEMLLTPALTAKLVARLNERSDNKGSTTAPLGITPRELQVLAQLVTGASNREIAAVMFVSTRTVKAHLASIFEKLGVHDRTAAATAAVKYGLVDLSDL